MKLLNLLETPLPGDWDKDVYSHNVSFAKRIEYAKQRAQKVGAGSSRVAFIIEYNGRKTVLKVAKNRKGVAQNEVEIRTLNDPYMPEIVIPLIDFDEQNNEATWLHTEFAEKMTAKKFRDFFGGDPNDLIYYAKEQMGYKQYFKRTNIKINEESEYTQLFLEYVGNYTPLLSDYTRLANWGIFDNRPVIIDVGLDEETYYTYYSK